MGTIRPARVLRNSPMLGGGSPTDADRAGTSKTVDMPELDEDEDTERSRILELFSAPAMQNPLAQYLQKLLGMGRSPSADEGAGGDELPVGSQQAGPVGANAKRTDAAAEVAFGFDGPPVGRLYPEYDCHKTRYRPDWCSVTEYDPRPSEAERQLERTDDRRLRRELARLGLAQERHRRQDEGDVLDVSALIDFVVDRRSGTAGDPRVYELKRRTAHDLGVLVLLDATGSTGESGEGQRIFDEQRELAARLTASFDELGDRVATYGFQSWGRSRVQFLRVKGFDDRYDHAAQRRLAALDPGGFTRLGAAIRHGAWMLSEHAGTSSTLLVVVGDGLPYDDGYEHRYAQEDCRRALREAVVAGVACACVSVRSSTEPDVIEKVWGNVPHRSLERPSELAGHVTPLFRGALKEAAASRRSIGVDAIQLVQS
jgi:nitric oxide reductase activation protein